MLQNVLDVEGEFLTEQQMVEDKGWSEYFSHHYMNVFGSPFYCPFEHYSCTVIPHLDPVNCGRETLLRLKIKAIKEDARANPKVLMRHACHSVRCNMFLLCWWARMSLNWGPWRTDRHERKTLYWAETAIKTKDKLLWWFAQLRFSTSTNRPFG